MRDPPDYPDKIIGRLVTDRPTPYVLMAENLAELRAQLPSGLVRAERQPADLPEVVEISRIGSPGPTDHRGRAGTTGLPAHALAIAIGWAGLLAGSQRP
jgi:hypothetical protein